MAVLELNPFERGNWIVCVSDYYSSHLTKGDLYLALDSGPYTVTVRDDKGEEFVANFRAFGFPIKKIAEKKHLRYIEFNKAEGSGDDSKDK